MKSERQSGITLVALIITIIVMLILVTVTVSILINSNVIGTAKSAGERTKAAYEIEANSSEAADIIEEVEQEIAIGHNVYAKLYEDGTDVILVLDNNPDFTYATGTLTKTYEDEVQEYFKNHNNTHIWYGERETITKVVINNPIYPTTMASWFIQSTNLTSVDLKKLNTSNVTTFRYMFSGCSSLSKIDIDVNKFKTNNATDFRCMFQNCSALTELDVSNFTSSNVTTMLAMFEGCSGLTELDLSKFNLNNVEDARRMFNGCSSLQKIYIGENWDASGITSDNSANMFKDCTSLVGQNETPYDSTKVDKTYAVIDEAVYEDGVYQSGTKGYLSVKE